MSSLEKLRLTSGVEDVDIDHLSFRHSVERPSESILLRKRCCGVMPVHNLHQAESVIWQSHRQHREIKVLELPPGVAGMLVLDLADGTRSVLPIHK
jgi:hypothetical protein